MRHAIGWLIAVPAVVVGATVIARVEGMSKAGGAPKEWVFVPLPASAFRSAPRQQPPDSSRVRALLQAARGTNALVCELAARTIDGRSGWSSDGAFVAGGAADSLAGDLVKKAIARSQAGDHNAAIEIYLQAYTILPNPLLLSNIGAEFQQSGMPKEALK